VCACVSHQLREIYEHCEALETGQNAQYIPQVLYHIPMVVMAGSFHADLCGVCVREQLARVNSNQFGIAVQTVDGQIWTHGDADVPFTLQSCSKPITYVCHHPPSLLAPGSPHTPHTPAHTAHTRTHRTQLLHC
jgi:hypothetical protein